MTTTTLGAALATAVADSSSWDHMGGWGWGMAVTGWVIMLAFIGLAGWAIWAGTTGRRPVTTPIDPTSSAKALLAERYARGDIDRDEFLPRRDDLEGRNG